MTTVDWMILLVIVIYVIAGFRKGFIATIASALGTLAALVVALFAASTLKEPVGAMFAPFVTGSVNRHVPQLQEYSGSVNDLWNSISGYLQVILNDHGISPETLESSEDPAGTLLDAIVRSVGESMAYIVIFFIAFIVLRIAIHLVVGMLDLIASLPVIHSFNALLGGLVGLITGVLLCTIVLWAIKLVVPSAYSDAGILSPAVMSESAIASKLVGWNDGVSLFEAVPVQD
ncbi:MAG: CvpA family protein [Butyricicoccus sp.]|nr:CvpA family protein [Butyricicoccus sp.]